MNNPLSLVNWSIFLHQIIRYAMSGGVAALVDISFFYLVAIMLGVDYRLAIIVGFLGGATVNFCLSSLFVFQSAIRAAHRFARVILGGLLGLTVNMAMMLLLVEVLKSIFFAGIEDKFYLIASRIVAIGTGFMVNFLMVKYYAFQDYR